MLRSRILGRLFRHGSIKITGPDGRSATFGDGSGPPVAIRIHHPGTYLRLALNPKLRLGEAYTDGALSIEDGTLYDFLDLCAVNAERINGSRLGRSVLALQRMAGRLCSLNRVAAARQNVAHHYDLSDRLFGLFLDRDMQYSCGYFIDPSDGIDTAQRQKMRHIAAKLRLAPGQSVLDIGSGWGGLAVHLARTVGCDVTGITLSEAQLAASRARAAASGLENHVQFALRDYRHARGTYDRIVSVGMLEHVGPGNYAEFFRRVADLLNDDGVALIHTIGRADGPFPNNPWVQRYIFPGAYCPALSQLMPAIERAGLWLADVENLRLHYAETLRLWNRAFQANRAEIQDMYDERFCRMWEFYLQGCEVGFRRQGLTVYQLQLCKTVDALPLTRYYMVDAERDDIPAPAQPATAAG